MPIVARGRARHGISLWPAKVQSSIQGDQVRVTGPDRDNLQKVIGMLKDLDLGIDMQFINYRGN